MGRQHQGMDRPGVRQVPEGSGEQGKMEVPNDPCSEGVDEMSYPVSNCVFELSTAATKASFSLHDRLIGDHVFSPLIWQCSYDCNYYSCVKSLDRESSGLT